MSVLYKIFITGGYLSLVVTFIFNIWGEKIKQKMRRKYKSEDKVMAQKEQAEKEKQSSLEKKLDAFIRSQEAYNKKADDKFNELGQTIKNLTKCTSAVVYNDIRKEALQFVRAGQIDAESRLQLKDRWQEYRDNYHDTSLDNIIDELDKLRTVNI